MLFASKRLTDFFIDELNIPEDLIEILQQQYLEAFLTFLETEVNLYLDRNKLREEQARLSQINKNDTTGSELINEFIYYYVNYPEVKEKVENHIKGFNDMFSTHVHQLMDDEKLQKMHKIINEDIDTYANFRKKLVTEI